MADELTPSSDQLDRIDRIRMRLAESRRAARDLAGDRLRMARAALPARGAPHAAGDRVFDTVTGLEAEVIHVTTENVVIPAPDK